MTVAMAFCMLFAFGAFSASADEIETPVAPTTTTYEFVMDEKASVKTQNFDEAEVEVKNAIRFTSTIKATEEFKNDLKNFNVKVKTIIVKTESLGSETFTKENLDEKKIAYQQVIFNGKSMPVEKDGYYTFNACLYNVKDENFTKEFSAISYVEINGVATQYTKTTATRSLWNVANAHRLALDANEDKLVDDAINYDQEELDFVSSLCATYKVKVTGFDGEVATYELKHGEYLDVDKISADLKVDGTACFKGTLQGLDITKPVIASAEVTADMDALGFTAIDTNGDEVNDAYALTSNGLPNEITEINVPNTFNGLPVVEAGSVFAQNGTVTKVTFGKNLTKIGSQIFFRCYELEYVALPGLTTINEGQMHFHDCGKLETVVFGDSITISNGARCFSSDIEFVGVNIYLSSNNGVATFTDTAYANKLLSADRVFNYSETDCLKTWKYDTNGDVVLSKVVAHAEYKNGVCSKCSAPATSGLVYTINEDGESYSVTSYTGSATEVYVADTYMDKPVTAIGSGAFNNISNKNITKVVLPKSVTTLGNRCFWAQSNLTTMIMPGVTFIPYQSDQMQFYKCSSLKVVVVGESFEIESGEATNFTRVFHDDYNTNFYTDLYVSSQSGAVSIFSPEDRNRLLSGVVYHYSEIDCYRTWRYDENGNIVKSDELCADCSAHKTQGFTFSLNEDGKSYAVASYTGSAEEMHIPATYHGLPVTKFNAWVNNAVVKKVVMPESVTSFGSDGAFFACTALETAIMPGVVEWSGINKFHNDINLKVVVINPNAKITNRVFFQENNAGYVAQVDFYVYGTSHNITIEGSNTMISNKYYYYSETDCLNTWKYVDGEVVKSTVGTHSFKDGLCENCGVVQTTGLQYEINADGQTASVIGYTGTATEVYVAGTYMGKPVTAVKGCAFWTHDYPNTGGTNRGNLTKIVLPNSVTELGGSCFRGQLNLTTVIAPGVTLIDTNIHSDMQFHDCYNLSTVVFGKTITITNNSKRVFSCDDVYTYAGVNILLSEGGDGTVGIVASYCGADRSNYNRMLSLDRIYVYSATRPADEALATTWCYVDGVPTLWSNVPVAE